MNFGDEYDAMSADDDSSDTSQSYVSNASQQDEIINVSMHSSVSASRKNVYADNTHVTRRSKLNVHTEELSPPESPISAPVIDFSNYDLENLIDHCPDLEDEDLEEFAYALKMSVMDNINEFPSFEENELDFLCSLMEEEQIEVTLKKIISRIYVIVKRFLEKCYSRERRKSSHKSRPHFDVQRQEYHESRQNVSYSSGVKRHCYRGDRRTNQEEACSRRKEMRINQEEACSRRKEMHTNQEACFRRKEMHTNQEEACSRRKEMRTNQKEACSRRKEMRTNPEKACSKRKEMRTNPEDTYSKHENKNTRKEGRVCRKCRVYSNRQRYSNRGERRSDGEDESTSQGRHRFRK